MHDTGNTLELPYLGDSCRVDGNIRGVEFLHPQPNDQKGLRLLTVNVWLTCCCRSKLTVCGRADVVVSVQYHYAVVVQRSTRRRRRHE